MAVMRVNRRLRVSDTWGCGRVGQTPRMEYTSTSFAEPLRRVFAELYRPTKELTVDFHPDSKYFVQSIEYKSDIRSWFEEFLYAPLLASCAGSACACGGCSPVRCTATWPIFCSCTDADRVVVGWPAMAI